MDKMIVIKKRGMGHYAIIIFFNMDISNKLSDGSPYIDFKKKVRLSVTLWRNFHFDPLHILYGENVGADRDTWTSESYM